MSAVQLAPYAVEAFNTAKESENRIHDDSIAKRFGFTGGLVPVAIDGAAPAPGTPILLAGAEVGAMRSARGAIGLALLRLDAAAAGDLRCGETRLHPVIPAWMRLPATPA